ncbi:AbrB/MazE/SpoVT family DNA-binding domain-containing protein [Bacillus dakarensis]|uniref:AbrB/MazE/SpoVT family DNA-binding domain-containing protein n=1 Tax=Robertmurraya dakarensis TaxID=1926278 RepID=UPI0009FF006D|nr:AbrB/MazE/SpoVT family DNA-binding domain-containing protein [Bacillus dakarensis]
MELLSGKMTSKGQITIPKELREKLEVGEGDQLRFFIEDNLIKVEPVKKKKLSDVVGRFQVDEPINITKMRQVAKEEMAKKYNKEISEQ